MTTNVGLQKKDGTFYALKTLPALFSGQDTLNAFKYEGELAVEINHPNVIKYYFFHTGAEYPDLPPYIIMEYAAEETLETLLTASRQKRATWLQSGVAEPIASNRLDSFRLKGYPRFMRVIAVSLFAVLLGNSPAHLYL